MRILLLWQVHDPVKKVEYEQRRKVTFFFAFLWICVSSDVDCLKTTMKIEIGKQISFHFQCTAKLALVFILGLIFINTAFWVGGGEERNPTGDGGAAETAFSQLRLAVDFWEQQKWLPARGRQCSAGVRCWRPQVSNPEGPLASNEPQVCSHLDTVPEWQCYILSLGPRAFSMGRPCLSVSALGLEAVGGNVKSSGVGRASLSQSSSAFLLQCGER